MKISRSLIKNCKLTHSSTKQLYMNSYKNNYKPPLESRTRKWLNDSIKPKYDIYSDDYYKQLGANQDSILEAGKLGIQSDNSIDFNKDNVQHVLRSVSNAITTQIKTNDTGALRTYNSTH